LHQVAKVSSLLTTIKKRVYDVSRAQAHKNKNIKKTLNNQVHISKKNKKDSKKVLVLTLPLQLIQSEAKKLKVSRAARYSLVIIES